MKKTLALVVGLCLVATSALAFHDHGVARCNGCHTMHNSQNGSLVDPNSPNGNAWLLRDETPSDVCLGCHATRLGAVFSADVLNPAPQKGAGNFIFLLEDNIAESTRVAPVPGYGAGHSIVAPGYGLAADGVLTAAPGGTFPASALGCSSCHDPHGRDTFRMLYGVGPIQDNLYTFTNPAPTAAGISPTSGSDSERQDNHTAYQGGMSAWCGNCHGDFHANNTKLIHKSGVAMGATVAGVYNRYNGTSNQLGGTQATAYITAVAFEDPAMTISSTAGPSASSQVSCISCHRSHATSAQDMGRWDFNTDGPAADGAQFGSYPIPNPYDGFQRSLCNKCHNKDQYDLLEDFTPTP